MKNLGVKGANPSAVEYSRVILQGPSLPLCSWGSTTTDCVVLQYYFLEKIYIKLDLYNLNSCFSRVNCIWMFIRCQALCFLCIFLFSIYSSLRDSLVAQRLKRLPAMWETWVRSLGWEDPLEKEMASHSSILAWRIPWMEEPGGLQSTGSKRVGHDWATSLTLGIVNLIYSILLMKKPRLKKYCLFSEFIELVSSRAKLII